MNDLKLTPKQEQLLEFVKSEHGNQTTIKNGITMETKHTPILTKISDGECANCGADKGLHQSGTFKCPLNGREETKFDKENNRYFSQQWQDSFFENIDWVKSQRSDTAAERDRLKEQFMTEMSLANLRLEQINNLKQLNTELLEALQKALPYIEGAYECAFPDEQENHEILEECKSVISKAKAQ